ncbi:hypothetical protein B0T17DRAFT_618170 [Bombardia bombarda]|uniref:Uncharacterized protein n=1 Tax=Bombardia bombarda TaxID=252184 RepID=A0AA39WUG0_9PEZI|nr:hypothetical protein B0T17DRAFT_618170 [Bombardia bombarda]
MSIITATTTDPNSLFAPLRQLDISHLSSLLLAGALQFQHLLATASSLFVQTYFAARVVAAAFLLVSKIVAIQTWFLTTKASIWTTQLVWTLWDSKTSRRFRRKIEFEFFVMFLGAGNILCLMLFWPGWILLAVASFWTAWGWS